MTSIVRIIVLLCVWLTANASGDPLVVQPEPLKLAEPCEPSLCQPPACRCATPVLSADVPPERTPQMVMLTYDDAVTAIYYDLVMEAIEGLSNPDGCPVGTTFFTSHEYSDYSKVHQLWADGHEIALHSISHTSMTKYWKDATVEQLVKEFGGQREMIAHFAEMDEADIRGMRMPLFQLSGNRTFEMMKEIGLTYDSSWPSQRFVPGLWPYSLDYQSRQDCPMGDCPSASLPGVWISPLFYWTDMAGYKCSMVDACEYLPAETVEALTDWMISNFERVYLTNRVPFGIYIHSTWFHRGEAYFDAYRQFLRYLDEFEDVYFVSVGRAVDYARNPRPLSHSTDTRPPRPGAVETSTAAAAANGTGKANEPNLEMPLGECQAVRESTCRPHLCRLIKEVTGEERWMTSCAPCPDVYPWVDNVLGEKHANQHIGDDDDDDE